MDVIGNLINLAIAVFTAAAAGAAWVSARASRQAIEQANKEAEESRKAVEESRKIAQRQTEALMTAAKANALASRINFYTEQIKPLENRLEYRKNHGLKAEQEDKDLQELKSQRDHLAYWLDRQTDALGVGLGNECPGSPYNDKIKDQA